MLPVYSKLKGIGRRLLGPSNEQQRISIDAVKTVIMFSNNDKDYKPSRAMVVGVGGTRKSFIINTIITIIRDLKKYDNSV